MRILGINKAIIDRKIVFPERDTFGKALFGGSRFIFWSLAPVLVLTGALLPFLIEWTPARAVLIAASSTGCFLLALGLYNPRRFRWALRMVTFIVFLATAAYVIDETIVRRDPIRLTDKRSRASSKNAIVLFATVGLSSLGFTVFGRFRGNDDIVRSEATSRSRDGHQIELPEGDYEES